MKIHVLGLPHTQTNNSFTTCAFTQKTKKLCAMMRARGHEVIHYGTEGSDVQASEHVSIVSKAEWEAAYPHPGAGQYQHNEVDGVRGEYLRTWTRNLRAALLQRIGEPHTEILAHTWGGPQKDATEGLPQFRVETGIGYHGTWSDWRVYESYAWLHMQLGQAGLVEGAKWYWSVIPNAFDPNEFTVAEKRGEDFLYLGRLNADKGIGLAVDVARRLGRKITIVGQGDPTPWLAGNPHVTYLPPVGIAERAKLLSEARAVFCLSHYVEPFCGVSVEAMLSGTPVITTDWGVFPETVLHGQTGYRCRTFEQMIWAADHVNAIDPLVCRQWATNNFSLSRVALQYEEYFQQVLNVRTGTDSSVEGFYSLHPERKSFDAMRKIYYPVDTRSFDASPHVAPAFAAPRTEWQQAQDWERGWWGLEPNERWSEEIHKQETQYFPMMGIYPPRDFGDKTILDVGCGPVSMLQRSKHGPSRGVDPLAVSVETLARYASHGVEFLNVKAEDMPEDKVFDEVWGYNVLQHTENPDAILAKVARLGKAVRIFEWLHVGKCPGHPQDLTETLFERHFPDALWDKPIWNVGTLRDHGRSTQYLAVHAVRKT